MPTPEARLNKWRTTAFGAWAAIGILILAYAFLKAFAFLSPAFAPFLIGFVVVLGLKNPVDLLEKRGIPRGWAVVGSYVVALTFVWVTALFVIPPLVRQLVELAAAVPGWVEQGRQFLMDTQARFSDLVLPVWVRNAVLSVAQSTSSLFVRLGNTAAKGIVAAGGQVAAIVFNVFLGFVVAFWMLKDLPTMRAELDTLAGEKYREDLRLLFSTVGRMAGGYLKGQTIASLVTAALAGIGFAIIHLPYAFVLVVMVFILNYVPYIGSFASSVIAATVGLFVSPLTAGLAIVVVLVAQNVTDTLVTPRVMSKQVDLHPTLVIFSLLVGGTLLGLWGMIVAIPVAATAKALFVYYWERRTMRQLASQDGALFRASSCDDTSGEPCEESEGTESDAS